MKLHGIVTGLVLLIAAWGPLGAQPMKTVVAHVDAEKTAEALAGCSFACSTPWTTKVSSSLPPSKGTRYDASRIEDLDEKTAWVSRGPGEYVEVKFKGNGSKEFNADLRGFRIMNGYSRSPALWKKNARVRTLRLDFNGKPQELIRLQDSPNVQSVTIPTLNVRINDFLRLTIVDVYPGTTYKDTCISELVFDGGH